MKTIVKMFYGSQLYGLSTPESDTDIRGIFLPDIDSILLGKIPRSISENVKLSSGVKNSAGDIDCEMFSLHHFINMACEGNTIALDMLHAPTEMLIESSDIWYSLTSNRSKFYTKKLKSYLGYARNQAHKYGDKGSRLKSAMMVQDYLGSIPAGPGPYSFLMSYIWDRLPTDENVKFVDTETPYGPKTFYEVCGRKIEKTLTTTAALDVVNNVVKKYGERSKKSLDGTDWKSVTHAVRACIQLHELYTEGTITFPLKERDLLMRIKAGEIDFETVVSPMLDTLIDQVEVLCASSVFPEKVDRHFWNEFILSEVKKIL
jgi:hypothetical protein